MQKKLLYIIVIGFVVILVFLQVFSIFSQKPKQIPAPQNLSQPETEATEISPILSIEEIKNRAGLEESNKSEERPVSLSEVYAKYPKEDTGNNIVESWVRVNPEEKAKVNEQLDKKIEEAKEELMVNPDSKKAKHILFLSETMKKLCKSNFDYKLLESVPEDEGGLKKR